MVCMSAQRLHYSLRSSSASCWVVRLEQRWEVSAAEEGRIFSLLVLAEEDQHSEVGGG